MQEEIQFAEYEVPGVGTVIGHENGHYIVRLPQGAVVGYAAPNGEPSEANAAADIAAAIAHPPGPSAADIDAVQDRLLRAYTHCELLNITPAGAVKLGQLMHTGNTKALAIAEWVDFHWAEFRAKQAAIAAGNVGIDITPSVPWKPFSYAETVAEE